MASIRERINKDGSTSYFALFRLDGRQSSLTFTQRRAAEAFCGAVKAHGSRRALEMHGIAPDPRRRDSDVLTVAQWVQRHIDNLTGVEQSTLDKYAAYLRNDIAPHLGAIPLEALSEEDMSRWVHHLEQSGVKPKTLKNKYGFLSGALNAAVPKHLPRNPAARRRLTRGRGGEDDHDMRMLSRDEFAQLLDSVTPHWRLLFEFLVASGCRWGEVSALQPQHVDLTRNVVKIRQAWKYSSRGYHLGPPKTKRSRRDVDIPGQILERLDLSGEWVFTNTTGGPVRYAGFKRRVWDPAVKKSGLDPKPTPHDLRHTYASWMLNGGQPITVVSRQMGHESIKMTVDQYGDLDRSSSRAAADFMGTLLS